MFQEIFDISEKKKKKGKKWENIAKMFLLGFDHPYLKSATWEAKFRLLYT